MRKETLVNHLAELPALYRERHEYSQGRNKDWLFGEELAEYKRLEQIKSDIDQQVVEAEGTVLRLSPEYPKEYQTILARQAELLPYIKQVGVIGSTLMNLNSIDFPQVRAVMRLFALLSSAEAEYQELSNAKEHKERVNSKVTKIRLAVYEVYNAEVAKVKAQTRERLEIQHANSLKRKAELEQLARSRQQEKLRPINARIRELLNTAIELGGETK